MLHNIQLLLKNNLLLKTFAWGCIASLFSLEIGIVLKCKLSINIYYNNDFEQ